MALKSIHRGDGRPSKWRFWAILAVVAVAIAVVAALLTRDVEDKPKAFDPSAAPKPSFNVEGFDRQRADVARKATIALTEYSYKEKYPDDFVKKLRPHATPGLTEAQEHTLESDDRTLWDWETRVVPDKVENRIHVLSISKDKERTKGPRRAFIVTYEGAERDFKHGWSTPTAALSLRVIVVDTKQGPKVDEWESIGVTGPGSQA